MKFLEEIKLLFNSLSTKSDSNMVTDLFHILIWGGLLLASIFGVIMFIMFIVLSFKTGLERTVPIFLYLVGSIFFSYILTKLRIGLHSKE